MYVALREMKDALPDGRVVRLFPGDVVENFLNWPVVNQQAALSTRFVRDVPDNQPITKAIFEREHQAEVREAKKRALASAAGLTAEQQMAEQKRMVAAAAAAQAPSDMPADVEVIEASEHACVDCSFVGASARGLAIHRGTAHKA